MARATAARASSTFAGSCSIVQSAVSAFLMSEPYIAIARARAVLWVHSLNLVMKRNPINRVLGTGLPIVLGALILAGNACEKKTEDDHGVPTPIPSAPDGGVGASTETLAVDSFKELVTQLAKRVEQNEAPGAGAPDTPMDVLVLPDSIAVKRTDDLVTPFRAEVSGIATLHPSASWFDDRRARDLRYGVLWRYRHRDGKWSSDGMVVEAQGEAGADPAARALAVTIRMRIVLRDVKGNERPRANAGM